MRWAWLLALLWTLPALAQDPEETARLLEAWWDEPLDLRRASASELAQLPWLDAADAERIVALRREGALRTWDDLARAGIDARTREAIAPFVGLSPARVARPRVTGGFAAGSRATAPRWGRGWGEVEVGPGVAWIRSRPGSEVRGGLRLGRTVALWVGDHRPTAGLGLVYEDPRARSSTRPVPASDPLRVVRTEATHRGGGLRVEVGRWSVLGWATREEPRPGLVAAWGRERSLGVALRPGPGAASVWAAADRDVAWWRVEVGVRKRSPRAAVALGWRDGAWRGGVAFVDATVSPGVGRDAISGLSLDRPHRVWQVSLRRVGRAGSVSGLVRDLVRDGAADRRVQVEVGRPWGPGRTRARARWDVPTVGAPRTQLSLAWEDRLPGPWRRRVVWRETRGDGVHAALLGVGVSREGRFPLRAKVAWASGQGSSYDAVGVPASTPLGQWLAPGATGLWLGWGWRGPGLRWGGGMAWEWGAGRRPERSLVMGAEWRPPRSP